MPKINPQDQFIVSKESLTSVLKEYGIKVFEHELPESGVSNVNVIIKLEGEKKYVLRILRKNKKSEAEIKLEIDFQNFLAGNLLPVPKAIQNSNNKLITLLEVNGTFWQCVLIEFLEGRHPDMTYFSENNNFLKSLAHQNANLYNISLRYHGKYEKKQLSNLSETSSAKIIENLVKDMDLSKIKNQDLVNIINDRNTLYQDIDELELTYSLIHDDINITNILLNHDKISGILDFDELYYGPVVSCAVNTAFEFVRFSNDPTKVFDYLNYFQEKFNLNNADLSIIKNLLLLRNMMFIVYLTRFHGEDFPYISTHLNLIERIR
jgi:Ser/Thr protein kinase RdoA (MazF antagonist)